MTLLDRAATTGQSLDLIPFPLLEPEAQAEVWAQAARILGPHIGVMKGTHDLADVLAELEEDRWQLWLNARTAICTQIIRYPRLKVVNAVLAAGYGKDVVAWIPAVEAWSKKLGCSRFECRGRFGWLRLLGLKRGYAVMIRDYADE